MIKLKFHQNWSVPKTQISLKQKCHHNSNIPKSPQNLNITRAQMSNCTWWRRTTYGHGDYMTNSIQWKGLINAVQWHYKCMLWVNYCILSFPLLCRTFGMFKHYTIFGIKGDRHQGFGWDSDFEIWSLIQFFFFKMSIV